MTRTVFVNGRVFDGEIIHQDSAVTVEQGVVVEVGKSFTMGSDAYNLKGNLLAPGFIDIQVNGGGGRLFNNAPTLETLRLIANAHRQFGTTGFLPTVITDTTEVLQSAAVAVGQAMLQKVPGILGLHLEGPCLNAERRGVHAMARLRDMDAQLLNMLSSINSGNPGTTLLTLAPELVSSSELKWLVDQGIVVFAGHSMANFDQALAALDAGVSGFTHLFNAMPPLLSREPGIVGAALCHPHSYAGIIADGFHVHPATFEIVVKAKQKGFVLLVTDAMASVGSEECSFSLYGELVQVSGGRCLTQDGTLAGSSLNMITAVKNAIEFANLDVTEALRMAATYPARAINRDQELGLIKPGYRASFVELDEGLNVKETWVDGQQS